MSLNRLLSRSKTVICKCRSNCTVYQPSTGEYTGLGQTISRSTRDRHSRDDKLLAAEIKRTSPNGRPPRHMDTQENHGDLINLFEEEVNWRIELPLTSPTSPLVFLNDPRGSGGYVSPSLADIIHPNRGVYALKMGSHSNAAFLEVETRFCELLSVLISMEGSEANHTLQDRLYEELCRMYREKGIEWAQQRVDLAEGNILVNTEIHYYERGPRNPIAKAASLTTLVMGNLYFASRRALRAQLAGLKDILRNSGASEENIEMIPKDPRAAYSHFRLEAVTRKFISCPSCSCLYPYNPGDNPEIPHHSTIEKCTYRKTPDSSPCDTLVWKQRKTNGGRTISVPCSTYLHQVLKFWLGRLLSRKGLEDLLDRCQHATPPDANSPIPDIWFSQIFSDLRDAQGDPFFPGPAEEGRLVFGLSVDGFNPFHMKTAKQTASSTGIWLVLLNFPPHLRYLPENMFLVGVLPDKPSQDQINHGLALVVGDLLEFWIPGVYFSRTYKHRLGKLYRAMLVPLVADMIAARQVLGLPGVTTAHYFCTFCDLDIDDIDVFDPAEWPQKNVDDIRQFAKLWRDAPNEDEQTQIFEAYGRRWTVLLDLPYWNPVLYAVIDSMHALDLGLFQNHCRKLFKIDLNVAGGDGATDPQPPKDKRTADRTSLRKCVEIVHSNAPDMLHKLLKVHRKVLYTVCIDNNIRGANNNLVVGTRWILANNIYQWHQGADTGLIQGLLQPTPGPSQIPVNLGPNPGNSPETPQLEEQDGIDLGKVIRIIGHLTSDHDGVARRGRALSQSSSAILRYIIDLIELDRSTISDRSKALLFALLITSIDNDREKFDKLASYIPVKAANRIVLGRDIMEAVWADMKRTQLPMWIRSAPPNWGTAERGKLSAEQWRVICTIHLPITLIRLWGNETGRKKELLSHFMDLVSAVRIANMRISSSDQIRAYRHHIFRYASRCAALYPDESIKPTLHAALHLCDTMELFGPVHAISAPFYERYINFFHRMNTNKKLGELESTFMRTAARTSSLRALLVDDDDLRGTVIRMVAALDSTEREDVRGYRLASILDPDAPTFTVDSKGRSFELEDECSQLLWALILPHPEHHSLPRKALSVDQISSGGASYATFGSSASRNSSILFHLADTQHTATQNQKAGVIQTIFQYTYLSATEEVSNFYLLVQEYRSMDIGGRRMDTYKRLGFAAGFLCKANETKLHVISLRQVISHVAFTTMTGTGYDHEQLMHAMPVDRLMLSFNLDDVEDDVTMAHMDTTDE